MCLDSHVFTDVDDQIEYYAFCLAPDINFSVDSTTNRAIAIGGVIAGLWPVLDLW